MVLTAAYRRRRKHRGRYGSSSPSAGTATSTNGLPHNRYAPTLPCYEACLYRLPVLGCTRCGNVSGRRGARVCVRESGSAHVTYNLMHTAKPSTLLAQVVRVLDEIIAKESAEGGGAGRRRGEAEKKGKGWWPF
eukprot:3549424-Rhodomonas_salina.2